MPKVATVCDGVARIGEPREDRMASHLYEVRSRREPTDLDLRTNCHRVLVELCSLCRLMCSSLSCWNRE
eukprot:scaffold24868_cov32-Tisochrysis_lutea.AAC.3